MHKVICENCHKEYETTCPARNGKKQICRDCYQLLYNNPEIKLKQANELIIRNLQHLHWQVGDNHISFKNETEDNFAKVLEYTNNEYTYEDSYKYINDNKNIFRYTFYRGKNKTLYILEFSSTALVKQRIKQFLKEYPNIKVHIIDRNKYARILLTFQCKINFNINKYKLILERKICPQCNKVFIGNVQQKYCSHSCKIKFLNINKKLQQGLESYIVNQKLQQANSEATKKRLIESMLNIHYRPGNNINIDKLDIKESDKNLMKILAYNNIEFYYEHEYKELTDGKIIVMKFYLPIDGYYYFNAVDYFHPYLNKVKQYIAMNINNIIVLDKTCYERLMLLYRDKLNIANNICIANNIIDNKKCRYCGKELTGDYEGRHYCSRECYDKARHKYIVKQCINCGNDFYVRERDINNQYFCSEQCGREYKKKIINNEAKAYIMENNTKKKFMDNDCQQCGKHAYYFGARAHKYCSDECKRLTNMQNTHFEHECEECHQIFINHRKEQRFCSPHCASVYNARSQGFGSYIRPEIIWNKGLTAATDIRIANMAQKQIKTIMHNIQNGICNNNGYFAGYYEDIQHAVRSGWEHNVARILQFLNLDYDYECYSFTLSNGKIYLPDFYVYETDTFYEVKGEWKNDSKNKITMFIKEYPDKKLDIIQAKEYFKLLQIMYDKVPFNLEEHRPQELTQQIVNTKYRAKSKLRKVFGLEKPFLFVK